MHFGEHLSLCLLNLLQSKNGLKQVKVLYFWKSQLNLRSWKAWKGHGKSHGKSHGICRAQKSTNPASSVNMFNVTPGTWESHPSISTFYVSLWGIQKISAPSFSVVGWLLWKNPVSEVAHHRGFVDKEWNVPIKLFDINLVIFVICFAIWCWVLRRLSLSSSTRTKMERELSTSNKRKRTIVPWQTSTSLW